MSLSKKILLLLMIIVITVFSNTATNNISKKTIQVKYFYNSPCASCNDGVKFKNFFHSQLDDVLKNTTYEIQTKNTFGFSNQAGRMNSLEKMYKLYNVPIEAQIEPILFINDSYLAGSINIQNNIRNLFLKQAGFKSNEIKNIATTNNQNNTLIFDETKKPYYGKISTPNDSHIEYFYTSSCNDCEHTLEFFKKLSPTYILNEKQSNLTINYNNILNTDNLSKLKSLFKKYNVPKNQQQVPIAFYNKGYLSGYKNISENLEFEIKQGNTLNYQQIENINNDNNFNITIFSIMFAGFMNGLNPCSVSMLLYLFSLLVAKNTNILKISGFYILGKSTSYFLVGFFIFYAINLMDNIVFKSVNMLISTILILLCLILFIFNLYDFIASKKENYQKIKLQLPTSFRKLNHSIIKRFSKNNNKVFLIIGSFGLGFIISFGEFLCTGQIYIATILSLFNQSQTVDLKAVLYLAIYVFCMAIPFIIFTFIIYKTKKLMEVSEKFRKAMPSIKLLNAILFLGFGIFAIIKLIGGI